MEHSSLFHFQGQSFMLLNQSTQSTTNMQQSEGFLLSSSKQIFQNFLGSMSIPQYSQHSDVNHHPLFPGLISNLSQISYVPDACFIETTHNTEEKPQIRSYGSRNSSFTSLEKSNPSLKKSAKPKQPLETDAKEDESPNIVEFINTHRCYYCPPPPKCIHLGKRKHSPAKDQATMAASYKNGNLLSILVRSKGVPPVPVTRFLVSEILRIVAHLHEHMIAHRNLSLENINLIYVNVESSYQFTIRLSNFEHFKYGDQAKLLYNDTGDSKYYSTQILGNVAYPKQRDIYSIGVILFTLLFGYDVSLKFGTIKSQELIRKKWSNRPNWAYLKKVLKARGEETSAVNSLYDLLTKLLGKVPFRASELLSHEWFGYSKANDEEIKQFISF
jgi:Protein kinase domain